MPCLDLEAFDPFEFDGIALEEGGTEPRVIIGKEQVQRVDGFIGGFVIFMFCSYAKSTSTWELHDWRAKKPAARGEPDGGAFLYRR